MCQLLNTSRSSLYYAKSHYNQYCKKDDFVLIHKIKQLFKNSRNNYGSRKIKVELTKIGLVVSKRKMRRIMKEKGLISNYTVKHFKLNKSTCNNDPIKNELNRKFNQKKNECCCK